jgi:hypothetical protein
LYTCIRIINLFVYMYSDYQSFCIHVFGLSIFLYTCIRIINLSTVFLYWYLHLFYYRYSFILIFCVFYSMQTQGPPPYCSQQTQPAQPPPGYGPPPPGGYGPPPPGGYGPPPPGGYGYGGK